MKRKFSSPDSPLVADRRQRKKSRRRTPAAGSDDTDREVLLLLAGRKPAPHLLVTEVSYPPPSHNPYKVPCVFNRRGAIVSVPLDGAGVGKVTRHPSAAIRRRGRLADLYRRCLPFIGATPDGRLAFAGSRGVFLVNPVTDALRGVDTVGYCQNAVVAGGGGGHGCSLFVSLGALLAPPTLWRLDDDGGGWSKFAVAATAEQTGDVVSAVNCSGCFYLLLHEDWTASKVDASSSEPAAPLRMEKLEVASLADNFSPPCGRTVAGEGHLVESDGEVLFVRKLLAARETAAPFCAHAEFVDVVGFEVYKLDVAERRWARVERLPGGGTAIFVSPESAFAVRTTSGAAAGCMMSNCVYFVGEKRCCYACRVHGGSTWGAYSMERREVLFEHAVDGRGGRTTEAVWFLPSVV